MMMDTHTPSHTQMHARMLPHAVTNTCTLTHSHTQKCTHTHRHTQNRDPDKKIAPSVKSSVTHTKFLN